MRRSIGCGLVVILLLLAAIYWQRSHPLAARGSLMWRASTIPGAAIPCHDYAWVSTHELVLFRGVPGGRSEALRLDTRTGERRPIAAFNAVFAADTPGWYPRPQVSPDGRWAVWHAVVDGGYEWHAARLAGSRPLVWPARDNPQHSELFGAWMSDSRHWMTYVLRTNGGVALYVHDTARPNDAEVVEVPGPGIERVLGTLGDGGTILVGPSPDGFGRGIEFVTCRIPARGPAPRSSTVRLPEGAHAGAMRLSADGHQLAWVLAWPQDEPPTPLVQTIRRFLGTAPAVRGGLWISRSDGSGMRPIGFVNLRAMGTGPSMLRWTPDGKRISFWYEGRLWSVPAD